MLEKDNAEQQELKKILLDTKELASYLNISITEVYRLKNKLPYVRINSKLLFDKELIDMWILSNTKNLDLVVDDIKVIMDKKGLKLNYEQ